MSAISIPRFIIQIRTHRSTPLSRLQPHPIDLKILPRPSHKLQPFPNHHSNINFSTHLSLPIVLPPRTTTCPQKATTKTQAASDMLVNYYLLSSHITIRAEQLKKTNIRNFVGKKGRNITSWLTTGLHSFSWEPCMALEEVGMSEKGKKKKKKVECIQRICHLCRERLIGREN